MSLALTEEQELLRSTAAEFVDREVVPNRARWDREELVDREIVSVSLGLVGTSIARYGTDEQRKHWLPGIADGSILACFGLTEPGTGSDAGNLTARAVRDGADWLLSGEKVFITNGTWAQVALVFARTGGAGPRGVTAFLVPTDAAGFEAREITGKLGLRG